MDFETVITVLFVLLVVVIQLLKRLFSSKTTTPGKVPTWKQKLDEALSQIREELQTDVTDEEAGPVYRDHILTEVKAPEPASVPPPERDYRAERLHRMAELSAAKTDVPKHEAEAGFMDLRKAVIWLEVLSPPLALRDEQEH
jgi:hypothetical protein